MKCELTSVETRDGIALHGAFFEGDSHKPALILFHGAAMNFYTGLGRFLPELINPHNYACLSANNRGHDFGTAPDGDKKPVVGLMRERFRDCVYDIEAWINYLNRRGYRKIVLIGHSQSIPKILYAQNTLQLSSISGLVLVSPPPSVSKMMRFLASDNYYERGLFKAQELTKLGMDSQLIVLRGRGTMPWIFTAETFLSFYGPDTPADTEELIRQVYCPIMLVRGTKDLEPVSRELLSTIKKNAGNSSTCDIEEIEDSDHFYSENEEQLGQAILRWLEKLS